MTNFLLKYAPDFCYLTVKDLFRMMDTEYRGSYIDYDAFMVTFHKLFIAGYFEKKPSPYNTPRRGGYEPALYRRIK